MTRPNIPTIYETLVTEIGGEATAQKVMALTRATIRVIAKQRGMQQTEVIAYIERLIEEDDSIEQRQKRHMHLALEVIAEEQTL